MKRLIIALCFILCGLTLYARAIKEERSLAEEKSKTSYALGMVFGLDVRQTGLELDYAAFAEGLQTVMEQGQTKLSREEAEEIVENALEAAMSKRIETFRLKEAEFLETNAMRVEVNMRPSGLQYEVIAEGGGEKPVSTDIVRVYYEGTLADGTLFDKTGEGEPELIPLDKVIPGWAEGIQLMSVGSKYRFYIPSVLAYGEQGAGPVIPPYSTLVFMVELVEIVREPDIDSGTKKPAD